MRRWAARTISKPEREAIAERMGESRVFGLMYNGRIVGVVFERGYVVANDMATLMNAVEALNEACAPHRRPSPDDEGRHSLGMPGTLGAEAVASPGTPYVIAVGDRVVIERKSNGQHMYMTYRSQRGAYAALERVLPDIPEATVVDTRNTEVIDGQ